MKQMRINMPAREIESGSGSTGSTGSTASVSSRSSRLLLIFSALTLCTLSLSSCTKTVETEGREGKEGKEEKETKIVLKVPITRVSVERMAQTLALPGVVFALPDHSVKVTPGVAGKVVDVRVSPGDHVNKGQVVALLDNRQMTELLRQAHAKVLIAKAGVEQARTNLLLAQNTEARTASLVSQDVGAQKDLVAAKSQIETAAAQLVAAKAQVDDANGAEGAIRATLTYTVVKSPISGTVAQRYLNISDTADTITPIVQIVDLTQVVVDAALPTSQPANIVPGQSATVTSKALPGRDLSGAVQSINPVTDNQGTTIGVRILCPNPDKVLKEGMPVIVSIVTSLHPQALTVPTTAVVADPQVADKTMVYKFRDGKISRVQVRTGLQMNARTEILSGLKAGDEIVSEGAYGIPDGTTVEVRSEPLHANSQVTSQSN
jgi:RND family efflux transporter MFP subunit